MAGVPGNTDAVYFPDAPTAPCPMWAREEPDDELIKFQWSRVAEMGRRSESSSSRVPHPHRQFRLWRGIISITRLGGKAASSGGSHAPRQKGEGHGER